MRSQVVFLAQQHAHEATPGQVARNAGTVDAAADHEHVKALRAECLSGGSRGDLSVFQTGVLMRPSCVRLFSILRKAGS